MLSIPVFVISLTDAGERRESIKAQLDALGITFEFFDAVDGRGFDVDAHPAYDKKGRLKRFRQDMTGGEIGCLLSHRGIYDRMIKDNIPQAFILEDDAIIHDDFAAVINAAINGKVPFDLVRCLYSPKVAASQQRVVTQLAKGFTMNRLRTTPGGAHGYLLTLSGAKKLRAHMNTNYLPVDTLIGHCWMTGLNAFIIQPGLVAQNLDFESSIGEARFDKTASTRKHKTFGRSITRGLYKASESFFKRVVYMTSWFSDRKYSD